MFNLLPGSVSIYVSEDYDLALKAIVQDLRLQGYPNVNITTIDEYVPELRPVSAERDWIVNGEVHTSFTTVFVLPMGTDMGHVHLRMLRTLSVKAGDIVVLVCADPRIKKTRLPQEVDNLIVVEDNLVTYVKSRYQIVEPKTISLKD